MEGAIVVDRRHTSSSTAAIDPSYRLSNWREYFDRKARLQGLLAKADIKIDGGRPWDISVRDNRFYSRVLRFGSIGLGDSYLDGWWECRELGEFFYRILSSGLDRYSQTSWRRFVASGINLIFNAQTRERSKIVAERHYDLGNTLYEAMLDSRMVYTTARWRHSATTLDRAQEEKLHVVCEALALEPGMRLLDIGCGWGSLARFAAMKYGVSVVGVTLSREQLELARERCKGLPIEVELLDYRDIHGEFDRIASLGMFEHVGAKNYRTYFETALRLLKPDGLFYLSTIGSFASEHTDDPWLLKHIFPNSHIPAWQEIAKATDGLFSVKNRENWGDDYGRTVMAWRDNFERHWNELKSLYDERFHRMWRYYLLASAAAFRARHTASWQILLAPHAAAASS
jgi:cyclopropane-fatty-acyl-phospholipid synthase